MIRSTIHDTRVQPLNDEPARDGRYVLYWMQQSQRTRFNHALEYAAARANALNQPLVVGFGVTDAYPEANARHYRFMLEGLRDVAAALSERGAAFVVRKGDPAAVALELAGDASLVVCDRGYLRVQKAWRDTVADDAGVEVVRVESDVVVPVDVASDKREFAARTLRPKVTKRWGEYLTPLRPVKLKRDALALRLKGLDVSDVDRVLASLKLDRSVPANPQFTGGERAAWRLFTREFLPRHLTDYDAHRNQPQTDYVSHMSKYLHFGQVSPVELALKVRSAAAPEGDRASFLEELLVRRELAQNFAEFTPGYDRYDCLPPWARQTLAKHRRDRRKFVYTRQQLEDAGTHDPYWNAAMREMRHTGYMHNHLRMYWGKKILEWSATPEEAYDTALRINNRYFIDGRDANSFANIGWVFGLHDRPWGERPIFGTVRYMSAEGLERKCDIDGYVRKVDKLVASVRARSVSE